MPSPDPWYPRDPDAARALVNVLFVVAVLVAFALFFGLPLL